MIGIVNSERADQEQRQERQDRRRPPRSGPMIPPRNTTDRNAPSMKMSPWAKLISSMIP